MAIHSLEPKPRPEDAIIIEGFTGETPIWWQGENK